MPKGIFTRPKPRGRTRLVAGESQVTIPAPLEEACRNFEAEVGGRLALVEHVSHATMTADQELLIGAIADPRNDQNSLARICYTYGLQFADLLTLFRSAGFVKAQLKAMQRVWERLPDVAGDVMERSIPHQVLCPRCAGTTELERTKVDGTDPDGKPKILRWKETCDVCNGEGYLVVQPRLETQKVALEIGGLLQQGPGVQVNVSQQQAQGAVGGGRFSRFYQESDAVVFPAAPAAGNGAPIGGDPVDAEIVEDEE